MTDIGEGGGRGRDGPFTECQNVINIETLLQV